MDTRQAQELIQKYIEGKCTESEAALFESWYNMQSADNPEPEEIHHYDALYARLITSLPAGQPMPKSSSLSLNWKMVSGVAAAIAFIVIGIYFFSPVLNKKPTVVLRSSSDLMPGKNAATLTLSNGKKIYISAATSGKLAETQGVAISKTAGGQLLYEVKSNDAGVAGFNTLETSNGERMEVILPDHSKVSLNAASSISYPSNFSNLKERKIRLSGEAYFEITKDKMHPFIVSTVHQEVRVLGTHFNVNAYPDEQLTKTTLLEGAVLINQQRLLKPGQLALNEGGNIKVTQANLEMETAWIRNDFYFDGEATESVMRKISRWYNISVIYSDNDLKLIPLSGHISSTRTLASVLERIGKAANLNFVVSGRQVTVEKPN